jgi:hypothetical protein
MAKHVHFVSECLIGLLRNWKGHRTIMAGAAETPHMGGFSELLCEIWGVLTWQRDFL